jgi:DNA-binding NarL/FixJ family response regulator
MAKPRIRVLVVDDYEPFRRFVISTLEQQPELQTVGEATDGLEAVRKAEELKPDLILLDIGLPKLNGIEAARRIRDVSPKSTILFFSENRSWDIVEEALYTGAVGYVAKSEAARELLAAVEAVLQGKQFVSSSLSRPDVNHEGNAQESTHASRENVALVPRQNGEIVGRHEVVFYSDDGQLIDVVSQFIGAALNTGNAAISVVTDSHRQSLFRELQACGVDIAACMEQGRYIVLDPADIVSTCLVNGMLESARFLQDVRTLILKVANAANLERPRVAAFGESADLFWKQGNAEAAIQEEKLCNQLTKSYDVDILCGYSMGNFQDVVDEQFLERICAEHTLVHRS